MRHAVKLQLDCVHIVLDIDVKLIKLKSVVYLNTIFS